MERQSGKPTSVVFDARVANLAAIRHFVLAEAEAEGVSREAASDMIQAVDEAVTNIIVHGYRGMPGSIEVELRVDGNALTVRLRDTAPAFDPTTVPAPDLDSPLHLRPLGGLGDI
jgi:serine/threonine-protein kinase RsbW